MKVLWVNPSFLDYRIPVYKKLNELTNNNFYLIYSKSRVPERVIAKINNAIGDHAVGLSNESVLNIPGTGEFEDTDLKLPYQPGLFKAISEIDADIIIGEGFFQWTPAAILKAKLNNKKFLLAYERTAHTERNTPKWRTWYRMIVSKFVDGYSVNGKLTKEYLIELGISEKKIHIGGMSADSKGLVGKLNTMTNDEKNEVKQSLSIENGLAYLYVGQITERKGVVYLLNAWLKHLEEHKNDKLIVVGTGPLYEQYVGEYKFNSSIKLVGPIDYDSIHKYYAISDVFIIPTLEDNWSLVVPEAMACGLPIACSVYNGCYPELVHEDVNGKLFDPLNEMTIIEVLDYFHKVDLIRMGEESVKIEEQYNDASVAMNIYKSCLSLYEH